MSPFVRGDRLSSQPRRMLSRFVTGRGERARGWVGRNGRAEAAARTDRPLRQWIVARGPSVGRGRIDSDAPQRPGARSPGIGQIPTLSVVVNFPTVYGAKERERRK